MAVCNGCGQENPDGFRFCGACGAPLEAEAPQARETRKTVTVIFIDVSGSTALGERLDPESLRRVMTRYFDELSSVLERHGGTVEKFIGDAIMAVFGIPTLHEDDALRAVRAAAEMRERLTGLNEELERDYGVRVESRTGVNTGEVVTGDAAAGQRLATGDAVNLAARLEQAARPGEILIGDATRRLVRDAVEVEHVEPLELKGKAEPVPAWRLVSVSADAPAFTRRLDAELVGRTRECALLRQAFDRVCADRSCHLFTVLGPAGIGKSRLVQEFVESVEGKARVLSGRCLPYGEGITYWPLVDVFRAAGAEAELTAALEAASPDETATRVRNFLETLARDGPLVLVLDDLQWAEPTFLDLVEHVAGWVRDAPVLVACMARPELLDERVAWAGGKLNSTTILLEPLTDADSARLLDNLVRSDAVEDGTRRRIVEVAEGNPLFVEEMAAVLAEGDRAAVEEVPPTIQALLSARLEGLAPAEREVVDSGSVEGKLFHRGAVTALRRPSGSGEVMPQLRALVRKELIRPDRPDFEGEDAFRFRHLLLRDAAYGALSKEARSDLHERFAAWLEQAARERLLEYEEILAYHLEQAYRYRCELGPPDDRARELARAASRRLAAAGRRAQYRNDITAAENLLRRAAALLPGADPERLALLPELATVLCQAGQFARAASIVEEAHTLAVAGGDRPVELRARIEAYYIGLQTDPATDIPAIERALVQVLPELEAIGDDRTLTRAWWMLAMVSLMPARWERMEGALHRALEHARLAGDRAQETETLHWLLIVAAFGPRPAAEALETGERALAEAAEPARAAGALSMIALCQAMLGRFEDALESVRRARQMWADLGMRLEHASTAMNVAWIAQLAGRPGLAEHELAAAYDELTAMGEKSFLSTSEATRAHVLIDLGRSEEASEAIGRSTELASAHDVTSQMMWRSARARLLVGEGAAEEGVELLREALSLAGDTDDLRMLADTRTYLAGALRAAGHAQEAIESLEDALELYRRKGIIPGIERTRRLLAELRV